MFDIEPAEATNDEIRDALGELTSITGGNLKSLMPGPSQLSIPAVVEGTDYRLILPESRRLVCVAFECEREPLWVTLIQREQDLSPDIHLHQDQ